MATTTRPSNAGRRGVWMVRVVVGVVVLLAVGLVSWISIAVFGVVAGHEFSPDTFERRIFIYYELPLVRARVSRVYYEMATGSLDQWLKSEKDLLPDSGVEPERWHLVRMVKSGKTYRDNAEIVTAYLDASADGRNYWRKWSDDHPKLAQALWPAVAEVCRRELYTFVPELFDIAEQSTAGDQAQPTEEAFRAAVNQTLARQYTSLADIRRRQGRHEAAIELYTAALDRDENFKAALRGRAMSHAAEGETEKAEQDRERL